MSKKTTAKKSTTKTTTRRVMTIAQLSRALNIDAKRARAKFRKHNVHAMNVNESNRHLNVVVSNHDANDNEHSLQTYCDFLNIAIDDARATIDTS